jgi:flagellar protein FlaG
MLVDAISTHGFDDMAVSGDDVHTPTFQYELNTAYQHDSAAQERFDSAEMSNSEKLETHLLTATKTDNRTDRLDAKQSSSDSKRLQFSMDKGTGRMTVSVINAKTQEVIREIPSEEILRITEKLRQSIGIMFDSMM